MGSGNHSCESYGRGQIQMRPELRNTIRGYESSTKELIATNEEAMAVAQHKDGIRVRIRLTVAEW